MVYAVSGGEWAVTHKFVNIKDKDQCTKIKIKRAQNALQQQYIQLRNFYHNQLCHFSREVVVA